MKNGTADITYYGMDRNKKKVITLPIMIDEDISYDNVFNIAIAALQENGSQGIITHVALRDNLGRYLVEYDYDKEE